MANGPGKYDAESVAVLASTGAKLVAVIVIGGDRGTGFSITATDPELAARMPAVLRTMADEIEGAN